MLLAIAEFADEAGWAFPSVATLAKKCRATSRHANRLLAALRDSGELEIHLNAGPSGQNRYRVVFDAMVPAKPRTPDLHVTPDVGVSPDSPVTPDAQVTLTPASATPDVDVPKPLTPTSDEPSLNRQEPSVPPRRRGHAPASADFDEFWRAYPRKDDKKAARKAFDKMAPSSEKLAIMLAALRRQAAGEDWKKDGGKFIPYPATWLNGERWDDEGVQVLAAGSTDYARTRAALDAERERDRKLIVDPKRIQAAKAVGAAARARSFGRTTAPVSVGSLLPTAGEVA
jgi:hypothetical protein